MPKRAEMGRLAHQVETIDVLRWSEIGGGGGCLEPKYFPLNDWIANGIRLSYSSAKASKEDSEAQYSVAIYLEVVCVTG